MADILDCRQSPVEEESPAEVLGEEVEEINASEAGTLPGVRKPSSYFHEPRPAVVIPPPWSLLGSQKMPLHALGVVFSFVHEGAHAAAGATTTTLALVCKRWYEATFTQCTHVVVLPCLSTQLWPGLWRQLTAYLSRHTRGQYVTQFRVVDKAAKTFFLPNSTDFPPVDSRVVLPLFTHLRQLRQLDLRGVELNVVGTGEPLLLSLAHSLPLLASLKLDSWAFSRGGRSSSGPAGGGGGGGLWAELLAARFPNLTSLTLGHPYRTYDASHALECGNAGGALLPLLAKLHVCRFFVPLSHAGLAALFSSAATAPSLRKLTVNCILARPSLSVAPAGASRLPQLRSLALTHCVYFSVLLQCLASYASAGCSVVRLGSALKGSASRMMKSLLGTIVPADLENPADKGKKGANKAAAAAASTKAASSPAGGGGAPGGGASGAAPTKLPAGGAMLPGVGVSPLPPILGPAFKESLASLLPPGTTAVVAAVSAAEAAAAAAAAAAAKKPKSRREVEVLPRPAFPYQFKLLDEARFDAALQHVRSLALTNMALDRVDERWPFQRLTQLDLSNNYLADASPLLAALASTAAVTALNLSQNLLKAVADDVGKLTQLTTLQLSHNELDKLPVTVAKLSRLATLHLDHNLLKGAPPVLPFLPSLTDLQLSHNEVSVFSEKSLARCTALRRLELQEANLRQIPAEISALKSLTSLNLRDNQLKALPAELASLPLLAQLDLRGNSALLVTAPLLLWQCEGLQPLLQSQPHLLSSGPRPSLTPKSPTGLPTVAEPASGDSGGVL